MQTKQSSQKQVADSISSGNKNSQAYDYIKRDILNNTFPPGTIMTERMLCEKYGLSRSPIRTALQNLTFEGLLVYAPSKGMIVRDFSTEDILEVYDLIEILQNYAVKSIIAKPNIIQLQTLRMILSNEEKAIQDGEIPNAAKWDNKFHESLIKYSSNSRLDICFIS